MTKINTGHELAAQCLNIAKNYKTLYVMGCFGAPMTEANKKRYKNNNSFNKRASRQKMIDNATGDTFGFDCVCLIKGILWGWNGDTSKNYGGAAYKSNNVPDIGTEQMINACVNVSDDFHNVEIGELLWMPGHVGIYVGKGLAVECSPAWKNCVQITACNTTIPGYKRRNWKKHGELPYVLYHIGAQGAAGDPIGPAGTNEKPSDWAQSACIKAVGLGVIQGDGSGHYGWKDPLTREQAIVILDRLGLLK